MDVVAEAVWELEVSLVVRLLLQESVGGCGPSLPAHSQGWFGALENIELLWD